MWDSRDQPAFAPLHDNGARSVAFSADGRYLATGDGNGDIYLWSAASGACLAYARDPGGQPSVTAVAFSPGSAVLAAGDAGGAYLWDTAGLAAAGAAAPGCQGNPADLEPAALTVPDGQKVTAVAFSPDGQDVATGDADGNTYLWTTGLRTTGLRTTGLRTTGRHQIARTVTDQGSGGVSAVAFSANGAVLATGDGNGSTYLWYAATGAAIGALPSPGSRDAAPAQDTAGAGNTTPAQDTGGTQGSTGVTAVAFRPGSPVGTLAVGDADSSTYLWPMAWLGY